LIEKDQGRQMNAARNTAGGLVYQLQAKVAAPLLIVTLVGGITLATGFVEDPERTWINLLVVGNYLVGLGLAGLLFVALHYVTGAQWSLPIRRVPEAMTAILPVAVLALGAVMLFRPSLYPWSAPGSSQSFESPLHRLWLSRPFFLFRSLAYLAAWLAFAAAFVRTSRRQDGDRDTAPTARITRLSAAFLVVFGVTCWLSSYDWIMSLEPQWASTIFGVYNFAGLFLGGLAAISLLVIGLRSGPLRALVNEDQLHDLGTLLFAFSSFWMYTWFCQYLLILFCLSRIWKNAPLGLA
jgi:hypothetical protein